MNRLAIVALVSFVLGVLLLALLEVTVLGVILLFVFIVAGVFAIADPSFLGDD